MGVVPLMGEFTLIITAIWLAMLNLRGQGGTPERKEELEAYESYRIGRSFFFGTIGGVVFHWIYLALFNA